jgi:hypothetical protein
MGQYYHIINVDKKQQLMPFDFDNGLKLMEWAYDKNNMVLALMNLMAGEWYSDRVYVVGDYADDSDMSECWAREYVELETAFCNEQESLYDASISWERIAPETGPMFKMTHDEDAIFAETPADMEDHGLRYIYNHATRQVIDLDDCPVEWEWEDNGKKGVTKIAPLPLLLAMGNGRGGGDYWNESNSNLVGSWCSTVQFLEVTKKPLEKCGEYESFKPNFTEK